MKLEIIVASSLNRCIGINGTIPWKISEDMKFFRRVTTAGDPEKPNRVVIMGRKTHISIGKALPKRHNIVLTRNLATAPDISGDCSLACSLESALVLAREDDPSPIVIGGASLYAEALPLATKIHLTVVHKVIVGDTFLPSNFPIAEWPEVNSAYEKFGWRVDGQTRVELHKDEVSGDNTTVSWATLVRI